MLGPEPLQQPEVKKPKRKKALLAVLERLFGISRSAKETNDKLLEKIRKEEERGEKISIEERAKPEPVVSLRERIRLAGAKLAHQFLGAEVSQKISPEQKKNIKQEVTEEFDLKDDREKKFSKQLVEAGQPEDAVVKTERKAMVKAIINSDVEFSVRGKIDQKLVSVNLDELHSAGDLEKLHKEGGITDAEFALLKKIKEARDKKQKGELSEQEETQTVEEVIETSDQLIQESKTRISEAGEIEEAVIESVLDPNDLLPEQKKKVHQETLKALYGVEEQSQVNDLYEKVTNPPDKPSRKPIHAELLDSNIDKLIQKHNDAREFYAGKDQETADGEVRNIVNEALKPKDETVALSKPEFDEKTGRLLKGNVIIQVPGGVAIVTSDVNQFGELINMGSDHQTLVQKIKERGRAGAYLKGDLAQSIHDQGYKGDVMVVYAKEVDEKEAATVMDRVDNDSKLARTISHEVEHLMQQRTLETIEDLHSGTDEFLNKKDKQPKKAEILDLYRQIYEGKVPYDGTDPLLRLISEKKVKPSFATRIYYSSKGIDFDEVGKINKLAESTDALNPLSFFESVRQDKAKGIYPDSWSGYLRNDAGAPFDSNVLIDELWTGNIKTADAANAIFQEVSDEERLISLKEEVDEAMKVNNIRTVEDLFRKVERGEIKIENSALAELVKSGEIDPDTAAKIYKGFIKETETRDSLFEFSSIVSEMLEGGIGARVFSLEQLKSEESTIEDISSVKLRRVYVEPRDGETIPQTHKDLYKFMALSDIILQKVNGIRIDNGEEKTIVRRQITSLIQADYNKGVDYVYRQLLSTFLGSEYLNEEELSLLEKKFESFFGNANTNELKEKMYGSKEDYPIPHNSNVDFSVYPVEREIKQLHGGDIGPVDALDFGEIGLPKFIAAGRMSRDQVELARQLAEDRREGRRSDITDNVLRAVMARQPYQRAGEEIYGKPGTIIARILAGSPFAAFYTPGKAEQAKTWGRFNRIFEDPNEYLFGKGPLAGHWLHGRDFWGKAPFIWNFVRLNAPGLRKRGLIIGNKRLLPKIGSYEFESAQLTASKNIDAIQTGLSIGLQSMGMDQQELQAFFAEMPMYRVMQMSPAQLPQIIPSQSELDQDRYQVWARRDRASGIPGVINEDTREVEWVTDFESELLWGDLWQKYGEPTDPSFATTEANIRMEISRLRTQLNDHKGGFLGLDQYGKAAMAIEDKIDKLEGGIKSALKMKELKERLAREAGYANGTKYTLRELVERARKAHEGAFWDNDFTTENPEYYKVKVGSEVNGNMKRYDLKDVNTFIRNYTRAYAKELYTSGKSFQTDPETNQRKNLEFFAGYSPDSERHTRRIRDEMNDIIRNLQKAEADKDQTKVEELSAELGAKKMELEALALHETQEYKFIAQGKERQKFFDIAWDEVNSTGDNYERGMKYFTDYKLRVMQVGMMERRSFHNAGFYGRLDRFLNHAGHWAIIAGIGGALAFGSPVAITIALVGFATVVFDAAVINRAVQIWGTRMKAARELQEKLRSMAQTYEGVANSTQPLSPTTLNLLEEQKAALEAMVDGIMKLDAAGNVKFPADRLALGIAGGLIGVYNDMIPNILSGKI